MKKIIHICFSQSAGGTLKYAVKNNKLLEGNKVIVFEDDISQGLIGNGINVDERIAWWNKTSGEDEDSYDIELKESYEKFHKKISKIKGLDVVYLWYGQCSSEICAMMYTLKFIKHKLTDVYFINVSDRIEESKNGVYIYMSVAEIMPEDLKSFIKLKRKMDVEEYDALLNEWDLLKKDNKLLRIFKDGKAKSVNENYFDIEILKYTEKEFMKSARIVGSVIGFSETRISDDYIFWRVKELVRIGYIEFKGIFGVMREMEIKITLIGLEYMNTDLEVKAFWENREEDLQREIEIINEAKQQGRMEEKISIAKKLIGVLDIVIIAEKTGLTVSQIKNL